MIARLRAWLEAASDNFQGFVLVFALLVYVAVQLILTFGEGRK